MSETAHLSPPRKRRWLKFTVAAAIVAALGIWLVNGVVSVRTTANRMSDL